MSSVPIIRQAPGAPISRPTPYTPPPPSGAWTPPQWAKPAMVSITVPGKTSAINVALVNTGGNIVNPNVQVSYPALTYIFDAVLSLEHEQSLVMTRHPVQNGAAISSHAYLEPAKLVLYVLMSDAAASYTAGLSQTKAPFIQAWSGNPSKSVSAYLQVLALQSARVPLTVTTRLRTYYNMIIQNVAPREDDKTITGARFRIEFGQIFIANTQAVAASSRPNETSSTGRGSISSNAPSTTTTKQFKVPKGAVTNIFSPGTATDMLQYLQQNPTGVQVPGAGTFSSNNINSLQNIPSP